MASIQMIQQAEQSMSGEFDFNKGNLRDPDALIDYLEAFGDTHAEIERNITLLQRTPEDSARIHSLFRSLHTLKSNAAMLQLDFMVAFLHPLEDLVGSVRVAHIPFTPQIAEVILLSVDRARLAADAAESGHSLDSMQLEPIAMALRELSKLDATQVQARIPGVIRLFGGALAEDKGMVQLPPSAVLPVVKSGQDHPRKADLELFWRLALMTERRSMYWDGRTARILPLALETNHVAGSPIDPVQLEAAVYMHDVGMAFLGEAIWAKTGKFTDLELREMRTHPVIGSEIIRRMDGWQAAAEMVAQHHERPNGLGYPFSLKAEQICKGATLLGVIDAFEAMTHERGDRYHKKSIVRTISEINASEGQFGREWIEPFNKVIRRMLAQ